MRKARGALVAGVADDSPAQRSGLRVGDVVLNVNGNQIQHVDALGYRLATIGIGKVAEFEVLRRGAIKTLKVALSSAPESTPRDDRTIKGRSPFSGITVANLSPALASEIGMRGDKKGVVVLSVQRGSLAARFGLRYFA